MDFPGLGYLGLGQNNFPDRTFKDWLRRFSRMRKFRTRTVNISGLSYLGLG